MNIYIWGTGKYGQQILEMIRTETCNIKGFIDNDPVKQGKLVKNIPVVSFHDAADDYDMIIISVLNYDAVLYQMQLEGHVDQAKVIIFSDKFTYENPVFPRVIDIQKWRIALLEQKLERLEKTVNDRLNNIGYEIIDKHNRNLYQFPVIGTTEDAIEKIIKKGCSLVRFGDGEFEIMAGKERAVFQKYDSELAQRLIEVISSEDERLLIAIANNYGMLDPYIEDTADGIRSYMNEETRKYHMSMLKTDRIYYDAYMFKSYYPYKDRENTWKRVELVKEIWKGRDVVLVEGDKTRAGYGNDLFDNVRSLRRILSPTKDAYDQYENILNAVLKVEKNSLILIVLGPVAELLVYDLMLKGYQAIDIGQIDMDYEWYRVGAKGRVPIPDRYVSQLPPAEIKEVKDKKYLDQIIEWIH